MPISDSNPTITSRQGEELDLRKLNEYISEIAPDLGLITKSSQFPGGYSNLTYSIASANGEYVLRRPPFGANIKSAHDMGREFKVLTALSTSYKKVPRPILYCEALEIMGAPFYIMERIPGIILRANTAPNLRITSEVFRNLSEKLIDNLVDLHSRDINKTALGQLGKPEGYVLRQVEGWIGRYYSAETDKLEDMDSVAVWLKAHQPIEQPPAFLHNDYKYDNVILDHNTLTEIRGVLDWEMATVGDPLMDLGGTLAYWSEAGDDDILKSFNLTWLPGNLSRKEVVDRYTHKSGRDTSSILFYYVFGLYKNSVIAQQIYSRWKQGFSKDHRFGGLLLVIKSMARKALETIHTGTF